MLASSSYAQKQPPPGQGSRATPGEIALLPKFCWWQYTDKRGPEYEMRGCGPEMGHYCWGLTEQLRARRTYDDRQAKIRYLRITRKNSENALKSIDSRYRSCPYREHVENTLRSTDLQLRAMGAK
jgi:hypothetical protein